MSRKKSGRSFSVNSFVSHYYCTMSLIVENFIISSAGGCGVRNFVAMFCASQHCAEPGPVQLLFVWRCCVCRVEKLQFHWIFRLFLCVLVGPVRHSHPWASSTPWSRWRTLLDTSNPRISTQKRTLSISCNCFSQSRDPFLDPPDLSCCCLCRAMIGYIIGDSFSFTYDFDDHAYIGLYIFLAIAFVIDSCLYWAGTSFLWCCSVMYAHVCSSAV